MNGSVILLICFIVVMFLVLLFTKRSHRSCGGGREIPITEINLELFDSGKVEGPVLNYGFKNDERNYVLSVGFPTLKIKQKGQKTCKGTAYINVEDTCELDYSKEIFFRLLLNGQSHPNDIHLTAHSDFINEEDCPYPNTDLLRKYCRSGPLHITGNRLPISPTRITLEEDEKKQLADWNTDTTEIGCDSNSFKINFKERDDPDSYAYIKQLLSYTTAFLENKRLVELFTKTANEVLTPTPEYRNPNPWNYRDIENLLRFVKGARDSERVSEYDFIVTPQVLGTSQISRKIENFRRSGVIKRLSLTGQPVPTKYFRCVPDEGASDRVWEDWIRCQINKAPNEMYDYNGCCGVSGTVDKSDYMASRAANRAPFSSKLLRWDRQQEMARGKIIAEYDRHKNPLCKLDNLTTECNKAMKEEKKIIEQKSRQEKAEELGKAKKELEKDFKERKERYEQKIKKLEDQLDDCHKN